MYLKRLELSGFKSFAKLTSFEFLTDITAIVGPNGSGKSNVVEAIRWVLGEQSLKTLRGKRGEDFIFSGSSKIPRLGRASVSLIFNNENKNFPVEYNEVVITRKVSRDGVNQYSINGSVVRLKDIIEMLNKVGLGSTGHHIISQGEADRFLLASCQERKEMIEDALGLKSYHIKRGEAERKLLITEENMKQAGLLQKEIKPHIKYLKRQADKMRASEKLRAEFKDVFSEYLKKENYSIGVDEDKIQRKLTPLKKEKETFEKEISEIQNLIKTDELPDDEEKELKEIDLQIKAYEEKRRALEKEYGRIEIMIESLSKNGRQSDISFQKVKEAFTGIRDAVESLISEESIDAIRNSLEKLSERIDNTLNELMGGEGINQDEKEKLTHKCNNIKGETDAIIEELKELDEKKRRLFSLGRDRYAKLREEEHELRLKERSLEEVKEGLKDCNFSLEKTGMRKIEFEQLHEEFRRLFSVNDEDVAGSEGFVDEDYKNKLKKKIDKLRIKIEEAGAVDSSIIEEYDEVSKRDIFLSREMQDLSEAIKSLNSLIGELTQKLEMEFSEGVLKINNEFTKYFSEMFSGGKGELKIVEYKKIKKLNNEDFPEEDKDEQRKSGIDISVSLPGKRIHSLDMLSGGERALTSIALLFAMTAVNPPPFLVLDETDAALDEANSRRYSSLLETLSAKTQLVVITHNRETMRSAGILYGVTMGGEGISKLLSLKFDEATQVAK